MNVDVRRFIDCYVFHDKVILLHNIHEIMVNYILIKTIFNFLNKIVFNLT